jgi:hypothetical protein
MGFTQVSDIVSFFIALAIFTRVVALLHSQCVDETRSDLFYLRDQMFLYAFDNNLLDTDAHRQLRDLMNNFIRYAHRLSATRVMMIYIASRWILPPSSSFSATWNKSLTLLNDKDRSEMQSFLQKHKIIIVTHMIHRSIVLRAITNLCSILMKLTHTTGSLSKEAVLNHAPWRAMELEAASA